MSLPEGETKQILPLDREVDAYNGALNDLIRRAVKRVREKVVPPGNSIRHIHRGGWVNASSDPDDAVQTLMEHKVEQEIRFSSIVEHDVSILPKYALGLVQGFEAGFMGSIFRAIDESTAISGNVVSRKDFPSPAQGMLAALKKIEFGVDENGEVSLPQFHLGSEAYDELTADPAVNDPKFVEEVGKVVEQKRADALAREQTRLGKFKTT